MLKKDEETDLENGLIDEAHLNSESREEVSDD